MLSPLCLCFSIAQLLWKLEERGLGLMELQDMSPSDIGAAVRHPAAGMQLISGHTIQALLWG